MTPLLGVGLGNALFLGILQGLTEFLPVSSSGHLAAAQLLIPSFSYPGVTLEVSTHLGTAVAVLVYYRALLWRLLWAGEAGDPALLGLPRERWIFLLLVATLPTAIIGFGLRAVVRQAFDSIPAIAAGWVVSGFVLLLSARARGAARRELGTLQALLIGLAQGVAVFPGVSRSGATISVGMLAGVSHSQVVTFSFLLAIPAIGGATLLDAAQLLAEPIPARLLFFDLPAATLAAGLVGYGCIGLVHRATGGGWWHRFGYYCWLAAAILIVAAR